LRRSRLSRAATCLGFLALSLATFTAAPAAQAQFGASGFTLAATNQDSSPTTQAGAHPYQLQFGFDLNTVGGASDGDLRDLRLSPPPGFLVNPTAVSGCAAADFGTPRQSPYESSASGEDCPSSTQVGVLRIDVGGTDRWFGLFNLVPPFGAPAAIGASPFGSPVVFTPRLRESDYGLDVVLDDLTASLDVQAMQVTIWGSPWAPVHDGQRGDCLNEQSGGSFGSCLVFDAAPAPPDFVKSYLTMPTTPCGQPLGWDLALSSWQGAAASAATATPALVKCNKSLSTAKVQLMTEAAAARTGLAFNLAVNDGGGILNPGGIARPAIKQAIVSLPEGLTLNPSLAAGLGTCSQADFARETAGSEPGAGCPNGSKIGTVTVDGALGVAEPLTGSVYLAQPHANPSGSLVGLYLLARSARRGLIVKSHGSLVPDPRSGRLTASFDELPRLLYTHFALTLREGQRSTLVSPPTCGSFPTDLQLSSWAEPTVFRHEASAFLITRGDGGPCPAGGIPPFAPGLLAGSINPTPAAYTPFYLRMTRTDGEQEITSYSADLPPGLLGNLSGIPACAEEAIEAARRRSGIAEQAAPSCPAASQVGRTLAGFGVGGTLAWAPGSLFLAGPYHGAPLSIVAIDPAVIGPFDLGTVVVRSAIRVDRRSAQVSIDSAGSDPIPHILEGIPLHLRDIRVFIDRPDFTLTPTSCDPMSVVSHLTGAGANPFDLADDSSAATIQRYQLLGCGALDFRPRLRLRARGATGHGGFPALRAEYRPRPGEANLSAVSVTLPPTEFIAQSHLRSVCSRVQFAADACPADSVYGRARAFTPLLDAPLEGPVYLRTASPLPELVFSLRGQGGLRIDVAGQITSVHNGLRATFTGLPDAPVSKFVMSLAGGRKSLLENERDLCRFPQYFHARLIGHNNLGEALRGPLAAKCAKRGKPKAGQRRGGGRR
jgi:hypothetical protein